MKSAEAYSRVWLLFLQIEAQNGFDFMKLIDLKENPSTEIFDAAWANILIKSEDIQGALNLLSQGLVELSFQTVFIDSILNFGTLVERAEVNEETLEEADWLLASTFVFKISGRLFPFSSAAENE